MHPSSRVSESTTRLAFYLTGLAGTAALTSTSQGAIVTFSDSGSFYQGLSGQPDQPMINVTLPDTSLLKLDPYFSGTYLDLSLAKAGHTTDLYDTAGRFTGTGTVFGGQYPGVSLLQAGDAISANNSSSVPWIASLVNNGTPLPGFTGNVSGYIGFVTPVGNEGWLKVTYNSGTGLFSYDGGAVETSGAPLLAGQVGAVPEPSVAALLALGAVGVLHRRRRAA